MKSKFKEYYRPEDQELESIWNDCVFILDANVLLNLYRYSKNTTEELLKVISNLKDRIWVPYQAALEYQRRRVEVISQQEKSYQDLQDTINRYKDDTIKKIISSRHPFIENSDQLIEKLKSVIEEIEKSLTREKERCIKTTEKDQIREDLSNYFSGKVGDEYAQSELEKIYNEGKNRYDKKIPPGYEDRTKNGDSQFGDLVLWKQSLDHAKKVNKPIIFITDEKKEDWWQKFDGKIIGPRPELTKEMRDVAQVMFYMYRVDPFMEHAVQYLNQQVNSDAIKEVRETRERDDINANLDAELVNIRGNFSASTEMKKVQALSNKNRQNKIDELARQYKSKLAGGLMGIDVPQDVKNLANGYDSLLAQGLMGNQALEELKNLTSTYDSDEIRKLTSGCDIATQGLMGDQALKELKDLTSTYDSDEIRKLTSNYDIDELKRLTSHLDIDEIKNLTSNLDLDEMETLLKKFKDK